MISTDVIVSHYICVVVRASKNRTSRGAVFKLFDLNLIYIPFDELRAFGYIPDSIF